MILLFSIGPGGRSCVLAGALSRAVLPCSQDDQSSLDVEVHAVALLATLVSDTTKDRLRILRENDSELQHALHCMQNGTPQHGSCGN